MIYAWVAYASVGIVAYLWYAPRYLQKKNIKPADIGSAALSVLFSDVAGILVLFAALFIWPIAVPIWIWIEIEAKKQKERDAEISQREKEAKANDRYYGLSLDQKLEILAQKVKEVRQEESNQQPEPMAPKGRHGSS